jgi:TonB family protein
VKKATVIISLVVHAGLAFALLTASQRHASGKTFLVQLQEEAKKKKKAEPPKPKAPPKVAKVDPRPKEQKPSAAPKPMPVTAPVAATAKAPTMVMPTEIAMSNEDIGDAVAIPVARPPQAVAPTKVATFEPEAHRRRIRPELGAGPNLEERCTDEPSKPEPVFKTEIEYTASARAEGIEGKLKLKIVVGADGSVLSVDVLASVSPELDAAAVAAVKQWRFRPAMACGKPVSGGTYVLARRFELGD